MTNRKYNYRKSYPRLSFNIDNLNILHSSLIPTPIMVNISIPGQLPFNIIQPPKFIRSQFQLQYTSKQQLKYFYGNLSKVEYSKILSLAKLKNISIISLIETRLDVLIFRLNYARSIFQARQFISNGYVTIDNNINRFASTLVPIGSKISINIPKIYNNKLFISSANYNTISEYLLEITPNSAILINYPNIDTILLPENIKLSNIAGAI